MTNGLSLFDAQAAREAGERGMTLSAEAAGRLYQEIGLSVLCHLADTRLTFTADDFWLQFEPALIENGFDPQARRDASGQIFKSAYAQKVIHKVGGTRKSVRVATHGKDLPVLSGGPGNETESLERFRKRARAIIDAEERDEAYPSGKFTASYGELYVLVKDLAES